MTLSSKSVKGHKKRMDYGLLSGVGTLGNWNVILKIIRKTVYLSDVGIRFKKIIFSSWLQSKQLMPFKHLGPW